jgi:molybdopterin-binding protein
VATGCGLLDHPRYEEQEMKLSARNQLAGTVVSINKGEAVANVELSVGGQRLVASITVEAVQELGLETGTEIIAVIKASDVMIGIN